MTSAEVEAALGMPPGDYREADAEGGVSGEQEGDTGTAYEALQHAGVEIQGPYQSSWHGDGGSIETWFLNDRLAEKMYSTPELGFFERLTDWLDGLFGGPAAPRLMSG